MSVEHMPRREARLRDKKPHLGSPCPPLEGLLLARLSQRGHLSLAS